MRLEELAFRKNSTSCGKKEPAQRLCERVHGGGWVTDSNSLLGWWIVAYTNGEGAVKLRKSMTGGRIMRAPASDQSLKLGTWIENPQLGRILIVDDQIANVRLLEGILRNAQEFLSTTDAGSVIDLYHEPRFVIAIKVRNG
jgi:hypothetical protein